MGSKHHKLLTEKLESRMCAPVQYIHHRRIQDFLRLNCILQAKLHTHHYTGLLGRLRCRSGLQNNSWIILKLI